MKEKRRQFHHRYIDREESLYMTYQNEMDILISKGINDKWTLYGHCDFPLIPKEFRDKSGVEGKDQLYY